MTITNDIELADAAAVIDRLIDREAFNGPLPTELQELLDETAEAVLVYETECAIK